MKINYLKAPEDTEQAANINMGNQLLIEHIDYSSSPPCISSTQGKVSLINTENAFMTDQDFSEASASILPRRSKGQERLGKGQ